MGGSFRQLFTLAIFAEWLSYVTASSALFVFRTKPSTLARPYHFGGYPLAPALFIVASAALLYYTFTSNLRNSILGSLVILAGVPVFYWFALRRMVWVVGMAFWGSSSFCTTRASQRTGAVGRFSRVPFPLTSELRPVCLSPGPDAL